MRCLKALFTKLFLAASILLSAAATNAQSLDTGDLIGGNQVALEVHRIIWIPDPSNLDGIYDPITGESLGPYDHGCGCLLAVQFVAIPVGGIILGALTSGVGAVMNGESLRQVLQATAAGGLTGF